MVSVGSKEHKEGKQTQLGHIKKAHKEGKQTQLGPSHTTWKTTHACADAH